MVKYYTTYYRSDISLVFWYNLVLQVQRLVDLVDLVVLEVLVVLVVEDGWSSKLHGSWRYLQGSSPAEEDTNGS